MENGGSGRGEGVPRGFTRADRLAQLPSIYCGRKAQHKVFTLQECRFTGSEDPRQGFISPEYRILSFA